MIEKGGNNCNNATTSRDIFEMQRILSYAVYPHACYTCFNVLFSKKYV